MLKEPIARFPTASGCQKNDRPKWRKTWHKTVYETNGIRLHCTRHGLGPSPLVMLHGLAANGDCWSDIAAALANEYDLIMPDFRGHGKSEAPESGYGYEDHAADMAGLVKSLALTPILMGHSMGGLVAALVASRLPQQIRGLILADPTFLGLEQQHEVQASDVAGQQSRLLEKSLDEVIQDLQARHPRRSLATVERIARARLETDLRAFEVLTPPNPDFRQLLDSFALPCLLIIADRGAVSKRLAADLQATHPNIQVAEIQDAGHGLLYDQPERLAAVVSAFLKTRAPLAAGRLADAKGCG